MPNEPKIKKINIEDGEMNIIFEYPEIIEFIKRLVDFFKQSGGTNYVTFSFCHPEEGQFDLTIQRKIGKSPGEINHELKEKIKELEIKIIRMKKRKVCKNDKFELGLEIISAMKASAYSVGIEEGRLMALEDTEYLDSDPNEKKEFNKKMKQRLKEQALFIAEITLKKLEELKNV